MNAKQKLHQIKLAHWTAQFQEQASSGLTVKAWCLEHNISIHTFYNTVPASVRSVARFARIARL